jgi:hypothetical protein
VVVILRKKSTVFNFSKTFRGTEFFLMLSAQNARNFFCDGTSRHLCSLSLLSRPFPCVSLVIIIIILASFSLHHTYSSSSWLLLSVSHIFISAHLSCIHHLLLVDHFIQYIHESHSLTTHHIIIRHLTVAPGTGSSYFSTPPVRVCN